MNEKILKARYVKKKCLVCGKKFDLVLLSNGKYFGGAFFGKMKLSIGKGEHKKIETFNKNGLKTDVVKWTGKEKEVEYWECSKCYKEAMAECWFEEQIEKTYGEKCKKFDNCKANKLQEEVIMSLRKRGEASNIRKS